jgi:hypothetical protein
MKFEFNSELKIQNSKLNKKIPQFAGGCKGKDEESCKADAVYRLRSMVLLSESKRRISREWRLKISEG